MAQNHQYVDTGGLIRRSNEKKLSCFVNSLLQNLVRLKGLKTTLREMAAEKEEWMPPDPQADWDQDRLKILRERAVRKKLVHALNHTFKVMRNYPHGAFAPELIENFLDTHEGKSFNTEEEGDPIELYHSLLQRLQHTPSVEFRMEEFSNCNGCQLTSRNDPTKYIRIKPEMLKRSGPREIDIANSIRNYTELSSDTDVCKKCGDVQRTFYVMTSLPDELVVSIERRQTNLEKAMNRCVNYNSLIIRDPKNEENEVLYDIVGVVVYLSEALTGNHHMTYIKKTNDSWMLFNDGKKEESESLQEDKIIAMFYSRVGEKTSTISVSKAKGTVNDETGAEKKEKMKQSLSTRGEKSTDSNSIHSMSLPEPNTEEGRNEGVDLPTRPSSIQSTPTDPKTRSRKRPLGRTADRPTCQPRSKGDGKKTRKSESDDDDADYTPEDDSNSSDNNESAYSSSNEEAYQSPRTKKNKDGTLLPTTNDSKWGDTSYSDISSERSCSSSGDEDDKDGEQGTNLRTATGNKALFCPHGCPDIFTSTNEVWKHIKFSGLHPDSTYEQCGFPACRKQMYRDINSHHRDYHLNENPWKCPFPLPKCCKKEYKSYSQLHNHIMYRHRMITGQIKRKPGEQSLPEFYEDVDALPDKLIEKLDYFGRPDGDEIHHQGQFILGSVNPETSAVRWGMEVLTAGRHKIADPRPCLGRYRAERFLGVGQINLHRVRHIKYDMGHLIAARNHRNSQKAFRRTFRMGNIFPMRPSFNRGAWHSMDRHAVRMTAYYDHVTSFAGPSMEVEIQDGGGRYTVPVPKYFWRILVMEKANQVPHVQAFLLPHEDETQGIFYHLSTLDEINAASGLNLLGNLNGNFKLTWDTEENEQICSFCFAAFQSEEDLLDHEESHDECEHPPSRKKLTCLICSKTYNSPLFLELHMRRHSGEKSYNCKHCEARFYTQHQLECHLINRHNYKTLIQCEVCKKFFASVSHLNIHLKNHTEEKDHVCEICGKGFTKKFYRDQHMKFHTRERSFVCDVCSKGFIRKSHLDEHMKIHTGERDHVCEVCGKGFMRRTHLDEHIKIHTVAKPRENINIECLQGLAQKAVLGRNVMVHGGEKPFVCEICSERFSQKANLDSHLKIHTGSMPFVCEVCSKGFTQKVNLNTHMKIHTGTKPYVCDVCSRGFTQKVNLHRHMKIHTGERDHVCEVCGKGFIRKSHLDDHMNIHARENVCEMCGKGFTKKVYLEEHMKIHTVENPQLSEVASERFAQKEILDRNVKVHGGEKPFVCDVCSERFTQKANLNNHMKIHTGTKPYVCEVCSKGFSQKVNLNTHMKIHTGTKPYVCEVCSRGFTQKVNLHRHMKIHTGTKPFVCEVCSKGFSQKVNLTTHMMIHTGEKPHLCDVCGKAFTKKYHLENHIRIHTGEMPYVCKVCSRRFTQKANMDTHMRTHETDEQEYELDEQENEMDEQE